MQRAAAKQLTRFVSVPLHRHQALFMNSTAHSPSPHHHQLLHLHRLHQSLQKLAIACTPSPCTLLRSCIHLSILIRCFSNGSPLPSLVVHDSDGLPSTQQSTKDRNNAFASDDCILKEAVDHYTCQFLSVGAHANQEEKPDLKGEDQEASPLLLLPETKSEVDTMHVVSHRLLTDPNCTRSSKDNNGDELVPFNDVAVHLQGNGLKESAVLEGLSPLETGVRHYLIEASSPSDIISHAIMDGSGKDSNDTVLDCQSLLENEGCINQGFEQKLDNSSDHSVDALSVSCILDKCGWGIHTESILQRFIGSITPELVTSVVDLQKNVKVAFSFLEWAGNHQKFLFVEGTFTKVIGRLGKESDFELAWKVLEYMKKHGLKVDYAFGVFIHRLKSASMVDEVFKAMQAMVSLDVIPRIPLFTVALQLMLKANKLEEAHRLYKQMRQASLQPDTKLFGILISGFGIAGQVDDALSFFKEMQRDEVNPDSFTYTSMIRTFAAAGQFGEGQKFYTEMVQNKCLPKVLSRLDLDCALYGVSSMEEIHRFLENLEIGGHIISVYTYNNMLQHFVDNKMFLEAVGVFCRLSVKPDTYQNLDKGTARPNVASYSVLISGLCKGGLLTEALLLFKEMLVNGFSPTSGICNCLLHGLSSNEGFMFEAVELSRYIARMKLIVDRETQKTFFRALHDGGDVSKALKIFESMKLRGCIDPTSNFYAIIGVAGKELRMLGQGKHKLSSERHT